MPLQERGTEEKKYVAFNEEENEAVMEKLMNKIVTNPKLTPDPTLH